MIHAVKTICYAVSNNEDGRDFEQEVRKANGYGVNPVYTKVYPEEPRILHIWYKKNIEDTSEEFKDDLNDFLMETVHNSNICSKCIFNHGIYGCYFAAGCISDNMKMFQEMKNDKG